MLFAISIANGVLQTVGWVLIILACLKYLKKD